MSNRDSLGFGDMVPQDVVDIFAHEKPGKNARKKRSRSLGRALGWLKGKRKKDSESSRHGLGPSLDLAVDLHSAGHKGGHRSGKPAHSPGNSHAPKRDNDDDKTMVPPLFQENVFIESSRPKYLEDLHTEALEGLKMMQQEETNVGVEYQDNESTISAVTTQTDGECGGFTTDSTIPDSSSVVSVQSSVSSRSGLTRQGSTFRPLNSGRKSEKSKSRRRHRKTVAGIPQHVQKELGLDRADWMMARIVPEEQLYNGESDYSTATEGPESPDGPNASLRTTNVIHPLSKDRVEEHAAALGDDLGMLHHLDPRLAEQRPASLAAHWVNTASSLQQEPPSPVMSMSPQAAYMSKIIPNAVLPPSIDVVEISRGRSRNSVRTVSKSSLVLSSPAPSRASSRASSSRTTSSKASTITSASRNNKPSLSDSNWSNSDSSETLVSNSSTISTSSTPRQMRSQDGDAKEDKVSLHSNGKLLTQGDDAKKDGQFGRSLSIMKAKRAPPPPSRSYSLHTKMKRRSRDLAIISPAEHTSAQGGENGSDKHGSSPVATSPGYNADTSSLEDSGDSPQSFCPNKALPQAVKRDVTAGVKQASPRENTLNNTISPSSGYSSRDASSPPPSKQSLTSSPRHKRGIFAKLQRLFPGSSSSAPASTPAADAEIPENPKTGAADATAASPSVQALRELFNIPRHPKVHAPPPPPPEVWAHSKRSFELLLGPPAPENVYAIIKKNPKDRRQQRQPPSASTDGSAKSPAGERKAAECVNGSVNTQSAKKVQESGILIAEIQRETTERLAQNVDLKANAKDEKTRGSDILNGMLAKAVEKRKERLAVKKEEEMKTATQATDVTARLDATSAISLVRGSPSPSPSVGHRIVPPPATVVASPESSWPPPPPPMVPTSPGNPDDLDFPLPPPPLFAEGASVLPVQVPPNMETQKPGASQENAPPTLSIPPPPSYTAPPPPMTAVSPLTMSKIPTSLPVIEEVVTPPPMEDFAAKPKDSSAPVLKNFTLPPFAVVSPPVKDVVEGHLLPPEGIPPPPPQLNASQLSAEATRVGGLAPPHSVPPPPPPPLPTQHQASDLKISVTQHNVSHKTSSSDSILAPPESIPPPPPPPVERLVQTEIISTKTNDAATKAPDSKEQPSAPAAQEEPSLMVTPSLLQMIKLRSVNSSPEPPKAEEPPQAEVKMRKHPSGNVPTSSPGGEPPQKPIRRSLIMLSPSPTSPPATVTSQPPPPTSVPPPPASSSAVESSAEKSSPSTDAAPSAVAPASTSTVTVTCTVETSPPAASAAPPEHPSPATSVEEISPATTAASPVNPASAESSPPDATVAPSVEVVSDASTVVSSVENTPPETTVASSVDASPASTVVSSVENTPPETTVASSVDASPASTVVSAEISSAAPTAPPTSTSTVVPPVETAPPATTATPTVVVSSASISTSTSTVTVVTSVEESPPAPTAAPASSSKVTSAPAEKSPPAAAAVPPVVISPASSTTVVSPVKKSPSATAAPSMNLQEAIRLRTAARSKEATTSRLSLHSPTSPKDFRKSPTSTASFIFSKTNKKVVIETKPEASGDAQKSPALSPFAKAVSEAEALKRDGKVPPPVAKKPKSKGKESESGGGAEDNVGQEAQQETIKDVAEKTNGTAGTVEGEGST
ncbi:unnamed protein product [Ophioblennius macclurei]